MRLVDYDSAQTLDAALRKIARRLVDMAAEIERVRQPLSLRDREDVWLACQWALDALEDTERYLENVVSMLPLRPSRWRWFGTISFYFFGAAALGVGVWWIAFRVGGR